MFTWLQKLGMGVALMLMLIGAFASSPAAANGARATPSRYTGYYYDAPNPGVIADLWEKSIAKDPSGKTMLDAAKCKKDGSCGAPLNYLQSFQAHDPYGNWTLENGPQKLRQLVKDCTIQGTLQMDRIERATGRTDINGMSRILNKANGECAWVNPETRMPVLAEHCANPIGVRVDLNCVYVDVNVVEPNEFAFIWARYVRPTDRCFSVRRTSRLFEPDSPSAAWVTVTPGCLGIPCNMANDTAFFKEEDVAHGQIRIDQPGTYQFRLEPGEKLLLCLKLRGENGIVSSSFGNRVRWQMDYLKRVGREQHARVYYQTNEMKAEGRTFDGPGGLAFYASTREDEAKMQGLTR